MFYLSIEKIFDYFNILHSIVIAFPFFKIDDPGVR